MIAEDLYKQIHENVPILCVDVIVRTSDGGFLLVKRSRDPAKGLWWTPGGRVLRNETIMNAGKRKIFEELGLKINLIKRSGYYESIFEDDPFGHGAGTHTVSICLMGDISSLEGLKIDGDHSDARVFHKIDKAWHPDLKKSLRDAGFD